MEQHKVQPRETSSKKQRYQLYLQPEYDATNHLTNCEALIRLVDNDTVRRPKEFLEQLNDEHDLVEIGRVSLIKSIFALSFWSQQNIETPSISINLSKSQMLIKELRDFYVSYLSEHSEYVSKIRIEMSEEIFLCGDPLIIQFLYELSDLGISFVVDNIISPVTALGYLKSYPVSAVKVEPADLIQEHGALQTAKTMKFSKSNQGINLIAKKVQNQRELDEFKNINVTGYQGYFFGKPCSFQEFEKRYLH